MRSRNRLIDRGLDLDVSTSRPRSDYLRDALDPVLAASVGASASTGYAQFWKRPKVKFSSSRPTTMGTPAVARDCQLGPRKPTACWLSQQSFECQQEALPEPPA